MGLRRNSTQGLFSQLLGILAFLALTAGLSAQTAPENPQPGVLDLRGHDFSREAGVTLGGTWLFQDNTLAAPGTGLLHPETPLSGPSLRPVEVPGPWHPEKTFGYGTYYLTVRLPSRHPPLTLSVRNITNSYRLYANGRELASMGTPGTSRDSEQPHWGTRLISLEGEADTLRLAIAFSNWQDGHGGLNRPVRLVTLEKGAASRTTHFLFSAFLFGALLIMGIYHIILYFHRRSDRSPLFFGILLILLSIRILVTGEHLITELFPAFPWGLHIRLSFLTFSLPPILFLCFIDRLFPDNLPGTLKKLTILLFSFHSLLILITPLWFHMPLLMGYQLLLVAISLFVFWVLGLSLYQRKVGAGYFIMGFAVLFLTLTYDILSIYGIVPGVIVVPFGILAFVFFQSLVITRKFSRALTLSERVSRRLSRANDRLERFVPREFLSYLQKDNLLDVHFGDHISAEMTIMFLKIQNLPELTRDKNPAESFAFLNRFLSLTGPLIRSRNGFIDKYFGDGFMALFPHSSLEAIQAGLDIRRALPNFNKTLPGPPIRPGIGIHRGKLMLGTIGENERMDGTVIADSVNLASRLTGLTAKHAIDIAVSQACVQEDSPGEAGAIRYHYLGEEKVKGKKKSVPVYSILPETAAF